MMTSATMTTTMVVMAAMMVNSIIAQFVSVRNDQISFLKHPSFLNYVHVNFRSYVCRVQTELYTVDLIIVDNPRHQIHQSGRTPIISNCLYTHTNLLVPMETYIVPLELQKSASKATLSLRKCTRHFEPVSICINSRLHVVFHHVDSLLCTLSRQATTLVLLT